jgi:hypothetical protein
MELEEAEQPEPTSYSAVFVGPLKGDVGAISLLLATVIEGCFRRAYELDDIWKWNTKSEVALLEERRAFIFEKIETLLKDKKLRHVPSFLSKSGLPMEGKIRIPSGVSFFSDSSLSPDFFGNGKKAKKRLAFFKILIKNELTKLTKGLENDKKEKLRNLISRKPRAKSIRKTGTTNSAST